MNILGDIGLLARQYFYIYLDNKYNPEGEDTMYYSRVQAVKDSIAHREKLKSIVTASGTPEAYDRLQKIRDE